MRICNHLWVTILHSSQKWTTNQHNKWHTSVYFSMLRSNVTGRHRGPKQKLVTECRHYNGWGRYPAPSLKWTSCPNHLHYNASHMLRCFHRRVWYRALSLRYAWNRSSRIILIPQATFVPNFISFTASVAELAHAEKSCTQSITHPTYLMGTEAFALEYIPLFAAVTLTVILKYEPTNWINATFT